MAHHAQGVSGSMKIVIFGGTTEGRTLSRALSKMGFSITVCVATSYGREEQGQIPGITVHTGPLDAEGMAAILRGAALCVDATHPYAAEATANIRAAAKLSGVPCRRLSRRPSTMPQGCIPVKDAEEAAGYLQNTERNILLAIGSKELPAFSGLDRARLYPRVLPMAESLAACRRAGIPRRNIFAMQGPFSKELNLALIRQFSIRYLVTKDGGEAGGFGEKAAAAAESGTVLIVLRPPEDDGEDYDAILSECGRLLP